MQLKGNPIQERGKRNLYCPHYNTCLDHAAKNLWQYFSCSQCTNKLIKYPMINSVARVRYEVTPYEMPPNIVPEDLERSS